LNFDKELNKYISTIHYLAKRMYMESSVCDKDDLVQAGMIGLIDGLEHYNEEKAQTFKTKKSTYIIGCIRNAMLEEANKFYGPLRLPHRKKLRLNAFKRMIASGATDSDIKTSMDMGDNEFDDLKRLAGHSRRDTVQIPHDLADINAMEPSETSCDFLSSKSLTEEEQNIIYMRLIQNMTYSEIGSVYGVKRETMRKRVLAILSKLRQDFKNKENE
jgi:RNA polymerase sigma factor (sigma-70 family)